jgi:signal transduction histidine kinase
MAQRVAATREDLEERVAARTREFLRAARYAELGVLAAGIAHEVNNPLASIASCAEGLQRRLHRGPVGPEEQEEYLETIVSQAYRAREVTSRLLALARQDARIFRLVNLSEVCEQSVRITRFQLEQVGVQLELDLDPKPIYVEGDALELGQMLVNLIVNGGDASPAGASVILRCHLIGDQAVLQVDDAGQGVPKAHQDRVFEPFFTTKRAGEGTGLGLALVHAIVKAHAGKVDLTTAPIGGARFEVQLPAVQPAEHS